jgi:hypothetical protein
MAVYIGGRVTELVEQIYSSFAAELFVSMSSNRAGLAAHDTDPQLLFAEPMRNREEMDRNSIP